MKGWRGGSHARVAMGPCHGTSVRTRKSHKHDQLPNKVLNLEGEGKRRTPLLSSPCSARAIFQKFSPIWFPACKRKHKRNVA
jgi:hypothetical protein